MQLVLRFIVRLEVSQQKPGRCLGVDSGGHVGDVAPIALGKLQAVELRPDLAFFNWSRSAIRTTWIRCVSSARRRLPEREQRPNIGRTKDVHPAPQRQRGERTGRRRSDGAGPARRAARELRPVDQHFHAVDAQLAVGIVGTGQQRGVVQCVRTLEDP